MDGLTRTAHDDPFLLAGALADASASIARLDQALAGHPLAHALPYRTRLIAVREQTAADGSVIDPWHLAAMIEGLRLRMAQLDDVVRSSRSALRAVLEATQESTDKSIPQGAETVASC